MKSEPTPCVVLSGRQIEQIREAAGVTADPGAGGDRGWARHSSPASGGADLRHEAVRMHDDTESSDRLLECFQKPHPILIIPIPGAPGPVARSLGR